MRTTYDLRRTSYAAQARTSSSGAAKSQRSASLTRFRIQQRNNPIAHYYLCAKSDRISTQKSINWSLNQNIEAYAT
jgi:hypothetical protein